MSRCVIAPFMRDLSKQKFSFTEGSCAQMLLGTGSSGVSEVGKVTKATVDEVDVAGTLSEIPEDCCQLGKMNPVWKGLAF